MSSSHVLVIGAGFSGSLAALHLLAFPDGPRVTLVERGPGFGPGLAYAASNGEHLLNVRAGTMSAYSSKPGHFVAWLQNEGGQPDADGAGFATRRTYGAYLQQQLRDAVTSGSAASRLELLSDPVVELRPSAHGRLVATFGMGWSREFDAVVLALGALPPVGPALPDPLVLRHPRYVANPWARGALAGIRPKDTVMLLGTGLTMVDVVTGLAAAGLETPILALSRRGLMPNRHAGAPLPPQEPPQLGTTLSESLRLFRRHVKAGANWRAAFDSLRPITAGLWGAMSEEQQRRFLRHLRPYWDVHRHRMGPTVAERMLALTASGQLRIVAGKLSDLQADGEHLVATWRPRARAKPQVSRSDWIINCTGQSGDVNRTTDPLISSLVRQGLMRPDRLRLGMEVDRHFQVVDKDGHADATLTAIGPLTRGALWESAAVPDLRGQAEALAGYVAAQLAARETEVTQP